MNHSNDFSSGRFSEAKLLEEGFQKSGNSYSRIERLKVAPFRLVIKIINNTTNEVEVTTHLYDLDTLELYFPYETISCGSFTSSLHEEVENILKQIKTKCFEKNVSTQKDRIQKMVEDVFEEKLDAPFEKDTTSLVLRHKESNKWICLFMEIPKKKLGRHEDKIVSVVNVKLNPEKINQVVNQKEIFSCYHMNKKYWVTILLEDKLSDLQVLDYIKESAKETKQ